METIRWGIIGTGNIAGQFARGLAVLSDARLAAVGSRTRASADAFGDQFDVPRRHASYRALAEDPELDVVYVATPHSLHRENCITCLEAGKSVLCEKPFTINAREAQQVIDLAREKGQFLMEAMWTRFLPLTVHLRELLAEGVIGELQLLTADLGFQAPFNPSHRLFDPHLGGGALLDVGVYPISLASMLFGLPMRISSMAILGQSGVDEQAVITMTYTGEQMAVIYTSLRAHTPKEAILMGRRGRIRVHEPMFRPDQMTLTIGDEKEVIKEAYYGNGYNYEAEEVMACLRAGKLESDTMPLDETLSILQTMDQIRAQWGLTYPMEQ